VFIVRYASKFDTATLKWDGSHEQSPQA